MRILTVDDNELNRKFLRVILGSEGHEVVEAADGSEAFEKLGSGKFDAVVTDILMPKMDGYRLCYKIRMSEEFKNLPVVVYSSTFTSVSDEQVALNVGADRFLRKPAARAEILLTVEEAVRAPRPRSKPVAPGAELEALKEYSEGLVRRLEATNDELDVAQQRLTAAYELQRESERAYRELVDLAPTGIVRSTPEGKIVAANAAFVAMLGYESAEELLAVNARDLYVDTEARTPAVEQWSRSGPASTIEICLKKRDGTPLWVQGDGRAVRNPAGNVLRYEVFVQDVDQRKRAEEALRKSEQRFARAFSESPIPTSISEIETGRILDLNDQFLRILGYSREEVIGKTSLELAIWADHEDRDRASARVRAGESVVDQMTTIRTRSGEVRDVIGSAVPVDVGSLKCVLSTFLDITDRRRAEEGMRKSEERFRKLFESNTIGIAIADLAGRTTEANDAYLNMLGYTRDELLDGELRWDAITPPEYADRDRAAVLELQRTGAATPWEKEIFRKDGSRVPVLIGVAMLQASEGSVIAYIVDLSERRQLEEQFRQAQKMEAVGQLAGGVAHDFNNLLTAILGYADLLAGRLKPESAESEDLREIRKAGERAAALTRQLLAFSRQQVLERKVLNLNQLIADVEKMLGRLIGEDITLVTVLDPALGKVWADAGQVEQVVMNLAVNARDAMPHGGKLTIETANVELDDAYARQHVTVRPGSFVMLAVSDNGTGMDAPTLARVFEPFFTTKERGRGTGLGLATVYGIVKQSGGHIWAYSEPEKGTVFKIYLPPAAEGVASEKVPEVGTVSLPGSETVLLVEDEESVRALSRVILENHGYTVLEAGSGDEALEIVRNFDGTIHLVLTDVVMPSMPGSTLVSRLETLRPGIKVLYMSGYTDDAVFRHGHLDRGRAFLQKPFTPDVLARRIREALKD